MIPYPGIAEGGSPILVLGDTALIESLFGVRNTIFALQSGDELSAYLAAQAVLSPAVKLVAEAATWLSEQVGGNQQGESFLRFLVWSSLMAT